MNTGLKPSEEMEFEEHGFVSLRGIFDASECEVIIHHMMDLQSGRKRLEGFEPRASDDWRRTHNQHFYDPRAMELMLDERLRAPLRDCMNDEPEGVQTMYFFKGSEQHRHQDQYYLPGCMSTWIALVDVNEENGTIWVQPGSHKERLIDHGAMMDEYGNEDFEPGDPRYDLMVDETYDENCKSGRCGTDIPVEANAGDVVLFHGALIHRGGPIGDPSSFRHVMANHYISRHFYGWPYPKWPRYSFDGDERYAVTAPH